MAGRSGRRRTVSPRRKPRNRTTLKATENDINIGGKFTIGARVIIAKDHINSDKGISFLNNNNNNGYLIYYMLFSPRSTSYVIQGSK